MLVPSSSGNQLQAPRFVNVPAVSALLGSTWAITEQGRQQVVAAAMYALQAREALPLRAARTATVRDGVAIVPIVGPLYSRGDDFTRWCGFADYETIMRDLSAALDDKEVKSIVLDIDSPGGLTAGCQELAAFIFAARGKKPIVAYVGGCCASAAYWIGSAADRIVAAPTALVGSIGCFATLVDDSEMLGKFGIKVFDVANEQSPYKVLDASKAGDRDRVRATVTQLAAVFIGDVAKHRGVSEDKVEAKFGKGDVLVGLAALPAGMIDAIGDFESLHAELAKTSAKQTGIAASAKPALTVVKGKSAPRVDTKARANRSDRVRSAGISSGSAKAARSNSMDLEELKKHASALHDAIKGESDADAACEAGAPHMKALHDEMGNKSPFYDDGDGDDEDDKEAKSFVKSLGGVQAVRGALAASEKVTARVAELEKQVAQAKAEKQAAELKALLDEATVDGRIAPAAAERAEMEKLHAESGMAGLKACLSRLPKKPVAAVEPAAPIASAPPTVATQAAVASLTPEERAMAKRSVAAGRSKSIEEWASSRSRYMAALKSQATQDKE